MLSPGAGFRAVATLLLATLLTLAPSLPAQADGKVDPLAGRFAVISPTQETNAPLGRVEVKEVFWYGSIDCLDFEFQLADWLKTLPADVHLDRMPALVFPEWSVHARAYFIAQELGLKKEAAHHSIFRAIHFLGKDITREEIMRELFDKFGMNTQAFQFSWYSPEITLKLQKAIELTKRYGVGDLPALIIDGKYRVDPQMAGGFEKMLEVAEQLIRRESRQSGTMP